MNVAPRHCKMPRDQVSAMRDWLWCGHFLSWLLPAEIPGALIVERWAPPLDLSHHDYVGHDHRVMPSFTQSANFTCAIFRGGCRGWFFPGVIVYLTHWVSLPGRPRQLLSYAATLFHTSIGSPLAGLLLGISWLA